jgi:hypothetical protein
MNPNVMTMIDRYLSPEEQRVVLLRAARAKVADELAGIDSEIESIDGRRDVAPRRVTVRRGRAPALPAPTSAPPATTAVHPTENGAAPKKRRAMSDAARERIRAGARKRWAKVKGAADEARPGNGDPGRAEKAAPPPHAVGGSAGGSRFDAVPRSAASGDGTMPINPMRRGAAPDRAPVTGTGWRKRADGADTFRNGEVAVGARG